MKASRLSRCDLSTASGVRSSWAALAGGKLPMPFLALAQHLLGQLTVRDVAYHGNEQALSVGLE